jgi:hypothetical protein
MTLIEIPDAKFKRYLPETLAECTPQQYIDMSELIMKYQYGEISFFDLKVVAFHKLLGLKPTKSKTGNEEVKNANIAQNCELIDSFFTLSNDGPILKQDYIHNPVPKQKVLLNTLYGPSDSFQNMTFGEYTDGLRMIHDFRATGDGNILFLLSSIFYRKKKRFLWLKKMLSNFDNNIRVPYNSNMLEKTSQKLKFAPIGFVYGFYLLFTSFQKYLVEAKILWGGNEIDLSILFEQTTESLSLDIPSIGMDSIAFTMAESGTFGTLEQVRNTNFWEIIIRMYDLRRADIESKKQYDAANK